MRFRREQEMVPSRRWFVLAGAAAMTSLAGRKGGGVPRLRRAPTLPPGAPTVGAGYRVSDSQWRGAARVEGQWEYADA